jgi:hypothetical protein
MRSAPITLTALLTLLSVGTAHAGTAPEPPPGLPHYDLAVRVDVANHHVQVRQRVVWTNRHQTPARELVFNVYPHYAVPAGDFGLLAKTLELLRMQPGEGMDLPGAPGTVQRAVWVGIQRPEPATRPAAARGQVPDSLPPPHPVPPPTLEQTELPLAYRSDINTALVVTLPEPVWQGETVTVELEYALHLPCKQGRWGQWGGVTFLSNWCPVLAYYDDTGWQPMPFIPWHQPFFNEAGVFRARITLPADQKLACSAAVAAECPAGPGWRQVDTVPFVGRDFAILCSARYQEYSATVEARPGQPVTVRCLALPEHEYFAREFVRIAGEAIPVYSKWFGPYPYPQFTIAESFFGWLGNECAGLIMIDERVFAMPHLAKGYVEYLVSHETCHQWWYNVVGTNGYCETFMDEGLVTYFTHRWLDRKLGRNNALLDWPGCVSWLPNIYRENYRYSSMTGAIRRGDMQPAVAPIPQYGHLVNLFTGAYDRGSKVMGMIEDRLGEPAFLEFLRLIYCRYYFRILRVADFQRELEAFTGQSWEEFFRHWVYSKELTDWAVEKVEVGRERRPVHTRVFLKQKGDYAEQTVVGFCLNDPENCVVRIPVLPGVAEARLDDPPAVVRCLDDGRVQIDVDLPCEPTQVCVDPDHILPDADPANNCWKPRCRFRFSPVFTMLDEADLATDYDRWNVIVGPWLYGTTPVDPWYTRSTMAGLRAGVYRTQEFSGGVFTAYRTDIRDIAVGADAVFQHFPFTHTEVGFNFEKRIAGPFGTDAPSNVNRVVAYGRYVFQYGTSLYLPPTHYAEAFATYQDNILPFARYFEPGAVRPDNVAAGGVHYRLDYLTPYWDPAGGFRLDLTYAGGGAELADKTEHVSYHEFQGYFTYVKGLPDGLGWVSDTRVAARIFGAAAVPGRGEFFALGGGNLFRGFDLAERQGSLMWVGNLEWRIPLCCDMHLDVCDHLAGLRTLTLAPFYDVGEIYADGRSVGGVAHALGAGLRADVALFSFIERVELRLDVAKTVNANSPVQVWVGVQHPF